MYIMDTASLAYLVISLYRYIVIYEREWLVSLYQATGIATFFLFFLIKKLAAEITLQYNVRRP